MPKKKSVIPRKSPKQQRSGHTIEFILEAAVHTLSEFGFDESSTNKIAKKAGVSIGSLYQYFPNKEALIAALIEREAIFQVQNLQAVLDQNRKGSFPDLLEQMVEEILLIYFDRRFYLRILIENAPRLDQMKVLIENRRKFWQAFLIDFEKRVQNLHVPNLNLRIFLAIHAVLGIVEGIRYEENLPGSREEFRQEMLLLLKTYMGA